MRTEGQRRSSNFEDRGSGRGGGGGVPIQALAGLVRLLGVKGTLIAGLVIARRVRVDACRTQGADSRSFDR